MPTLLYCPPIQPKMAKPQDSSPGTDRNQSASKSFGLIFPGFELSRFSLIEELEIDIVFQASNRTSYQPKFICQVP